MAAWAAFFASLAAKQQSSAMKSDDRRSERKNSAPMRRCTTAKKRKRWQSTISRRPLIGKGGGRASGVPPGTLRRHFFFSGLHAMHINKTKNAILSGKSVESNAEKGNGARAGPIGNRICSPLEMVTVSPPSRVIVEIGLLSLPLSACVSLGNQLTSRAKTLRFPLSPEKEGERDRGGTKESALSALSLSLVKKTKNQRLKKNCDFSLVPLSAPLRLDFPFFLLFLKFRNERRAAAGARER